MGTEVDEMARAYAAGKGAELAARLVEMHSAATPKQALRRAGRR